LREVDLVAAKHRIEPLAIERRLRTRMAQERDQQFILIGLERGPRQLFGLRQHVAELQHHAVDTVHGFSLMTWAILRDTDASFNKRANSIA